MSRLVVPSAVLVGAFWGGPLPVCRFGLPPSLVAMPGNRPKCAAMSMPFCVVFTPKLIEAGNRPLPMLETLLLPLAEPTQVRPPDTGAALAALWQFDQM